jgi:hypothetical protein
LAIIGQFDDRVGDDMARARRAAVIELDPLAPHSGNCVPPPDLMPARHDAGMIEQGGGFIKARIVDQLRIG